MKAYQRKMLYILGSLFTSVMILFGFREYMIWRLPYDDVQVPLFEHEERIEIPRRPGIQGVVITGPIIEPLLFSIDLSKAGVQALDWERLNSIDPHTDVKINCTLDDQGRLVFSRQDVLMEGHTETGMIIQRTLKTWMYTPYKNGVIRFWFNLPSKGKKLIIDTSGLYRRRDIPAHIPVLNGQIHYIRGIALEEIQERGRF